MREYNAMDLAALDAGRFEYNVYYEQKLMPIFSIDTANYLIKRGFNVLKIKSNRYETGKVVFFFEETPEAIAVRDEQYRKFKGLE